MIYMETRLTDKILLRRILVLIVTIIMATSAIMIAMSAPFCVFAAQQEESGLKSESTPTQNATADNKQASINLESPSAILMEASTGQIIYEKNAEDALPPASVTKVMTLLLVFDAIKDGKVNLQDMVTVSEHAASMGGSQVFLEPGETQTVDTMIKCISMASANDACVAMAEHICGTEEAFVARMNERAAGLGMQNTHFINCCGLDVDGHVSSAKDIAIMSKELIVKHPEISKYSTVWMDTITHSTRRGDSEFGLTNTNKLIKQYEWATGLKTGSTSKAGCCLSATAKKDGIELIAVILAAPNSKTRFAEAINLLNYGYSVCDIYTDKSMPELMDMQVKGGKEPYVKLEYDKDFSYMFMDKTDHNLITKELKLNEGVTAPVTKGDCVGELVYTYEGKMLGAVEVKAANNIEKATYIDTLIKMIDNLLF